jgi:hypothetical protein
MNSLKLTPTLEKRLRLIAETGGAGSPSTVSPGSTQILGQKGLVNITLGRAYVSAAGAEWIIRKDRMTAAEERAAAPPLFDRNEVMLMALDAGLTVAPNDVDRLQTFAAAAVAKAAQKSDFKITI